ncbi:MAG TPA: hypothetical protein VKV21_13600 [Solirubrobacteraceae bacterium]|nr:hypothetical protein [Solirubrobacteraceae bacterium]
MADQRPSYIGHGIGSAVVWALILLAARRRADSATQERLTTVCGGWWLGYVSASIARIGSAPPRPLSPEAERRLQRGSLALVALGLGSVARVLRSGRPAASRAP